MDISQHNSSRAMSSITPSSNDLNPIQSDTITGVGNAISRSSIPRLRLETATPEALVKYGINQSLRHGGPHTDQNNYLASWHYTLENLGNSPLTDLLSQVKFIREPLTLSDGTVIDTVRTTDWGRDAYIARNQAVNKIPHTPQLDEREIGRTWKLASEPCCPLCKRVSISMDTSYRGDPRLSPVMLDFGGSFLTPNAFPTLIGGSLLLRKDHDTHPQTGEVLSITTGRALGGSNVTAYEFHDVLLLSRTLDLVGLLNHRKDGMSNPDHMHWHTFSREFFPNDHIRQVLGKSLDLVSTEPVTVSLASGTPFVLLTVAGGSPEHRASRAGEISDYLSLKEIPFTAVVIDGVICISPRKDAGLSYWKVGSTAGLNYFVSEIPNARTLEQHLYKTTDASWQSFCDRLNATSINPSVVSAKSVPIILNTNIEPWEQWQTIWPQSSALWEELRALQDKRYDAGHAATVTWFSLALGEALKLSNEERQIAVNAAIVHDIGWSLIPNIAERFARLELALLSSDAAVQTWAKKENHDLRVQHQQLAVDHARPILERLGIANIDQILQIVSDHDTRNYPPRSRAEAVMRDADILWRFTPAAYDAYEQRTHGSPAEFFDVFLNQLRLSRELLAMPVSLEVGARQLSVTAEKLS